MTRLTWQDVDKLKSEGRYMHAGALAFILGYDGRLGCHFGLRSHYHHACAAFARGHDLARLDTLRLGF